MQTGHINQNIDIYENDNVSDGYTGVSQAIKETPYWSTWAEIKPLRSSRNLEANQTELKPVYNFKVRYRNDKNLLDNMVVKWRGTFFIIQGYIPDVVYQEYMSFDAIPFNIGDLVAGTEETT